MDVESGIIPELNWQIDIAIELVARREKELERQLTPIEKRWLIRAVMKHKYGERLGSEVAEEIFEHLGIRWL